MANQTIPLRFRRPATLSVGWNNLLMLAAALLDPVALVLSLWAAAYYTQGHISPPYLVLSLLVFSLTLPGTVRLQVSIWKAMSSIVVGWAVIAGLLYFFGYASGYLDYFDPETLQIWLWLAPTSQLGVHLAMRSFAPSLANIQGEPKRAVIAGVNEHGVMLAREFEQNPYTPTRLAGFFDDRVRERVGGLTEFPLLGTIDQLPVYVRQQRIEAIYISLPMASQPRILKLLDELSDTTASIYFVPDMFITDLMQARIDSVGDIPVVAVCETPFTGVNGMIKRASDIVMSLIILTLISPLLLIIAFSIWLTSPGPIIFKQRRYGLNGEEILVSKFRSMSVCEDGETVQQVQKNDSRVTKVGAFLRKTSLDELPQFFNVLQGRMSIVGPRPHAVAHNELYRTMIKGYMVRHKVKPGITGWAQVNGWRGETDTLEKMKTRIEYDLAYLRNWSLRLDLYIIFKTIAVVLKDHHA
ncbi:MAG TPA: undecaprenyl-phosphate glucose phosphotransferase, partial [Methylophilaceae bacterium]|nr:undecaprenyl-phosphate glucose phosphotransferase [Methylophilaceae bacterium]